MEIAMFMASPTGRVARIVAGVVLIVLGLMLGGAIGWLLAIIGLVPIAAGAGNVCLLAPILGAPFKGADTKR